MVHVLGRMSERLGRGVSLGTVRNTNLDFADDAVIFAEIIGVLADDSIRLARSRASWIAEPPRSEPKVTQTLVVDTECQDAIYGRILMCETKLLMALVT